MSRYFNPLEGGKPAFVYNRPEALRALASLSECARNLASTCANLDDSARESVRFAVREIRSTIRTAQRAAVAGGVDPATVANALGVPDRLRDLIDEWGTHETCPVCDGYGATIYGEDEERCARCAGLGTAEREWVQHAHR